MGRFSRTLEDLLPRHGSLIDSDGNLFDVAAMRWFEQRYDLRWQTITNGAVRFSFVNRDITADTVDIGIKVPQGRRLIAFDLQITFTEGEYITTVYDAPNGFTFNEQNKFYKSELWQRDEPRGTVGTEIYCSVTANEPLGNLLQQTYVDVGSINGPGRPGGATGIEKVVAGFFNDRIVRIHNLGGQPAAYSWLLIAWEEGK